MAAMPHASARAILSVQSDAIIAIAAGGAGVRTRILMVQSFSRMEEGAIGQVLHGRVTCLSFLDCDLLPLSAHGFG
jgi:hypothetical protein